VGSYLLYLITHTIIPLRVSHAEEEMGLDLSQHGEIMDAPLVAETTTGEMKRVVDL